MSDDFFNNFENQKKPAAATEARNAPPPPPNRPPSSLAAAAASIPSNAPTRPPPTSSGQPATSGADGTASRTLPSRPLTAAGPRPSGTNVGAPSSAATPPRSRHQLQQTRATQSRATATARPSTHLTSSGKPVSGPSVTSASASTTTGFYQTSAGAPKSNPVDGGATQTSRSFQPPVFTPQQPSQSQQSSQDSFVAGQIQQPIQTKPYDFYSQPQSMPMTQARPMAPTYSTNMQQPQQSGSELSGWMNTSAPTTFSGAMDSGFGTAGTSSMSTPSYFTPQMTTNASSTSIAQGGSFYSDSEFLDEPPLLEELGINMEHIMFKTKAVVLPFARLPFIKTSASSSSSPQYAHDDDTSSIIIKDADLAGPLVFALLLGAELLVTGKLHSFGYIYGLSVFGCGCLALILNLMKGPLGHAYDHTQMQSASLSISIWTTISILGYALLPVNVLAGVKILFTMMLLQHNATVSRVLQLLGALTVLWCTAASTRLLEVGCDMRAQRYLIAYPIALLYSAFVLVTIF